MEEKVRCQSCGMPLSELFGNYGTNRDGSNNSEYCSVCFKNGEFTNPKQTMEQMIQSSIDNMTNDLQMPLETATSLAQSVIPSLRRWARQKQRGPS